MSVPRSQTMSCRSFAIVGAMRDAIGGRDVLNFFPRPAESLTTTFPSILAGSQGSNPVREKAALILEGTNTFFSALVRHPTRSNTLNFQILLIARSFQRTWAHLSSRSSCFKGLNRATSSCCVI